MNERRSLEKADIEIVDDRPSHVEKPSQVVEIGTFRVVGISPEDVEFFTSFPEERRKKIFRKVP
jgi:recombinational DNA repair ATPase RecF